MLPLLEAILSKVNKDKRGKHENVSPFPAIDAALKPRLFKNL
jgi:hypothetical protein